MSNIARFAAYAAAFEKSFETDDWSTVAPFFSENAVYITGDELQPCVHSSANQGASSLRRGLFMSLGNLEMAVTLCLDCLETDERLSWAFGIALAVESAAIVKISRRGLARQGRKERHCGMH